MNIPYHYYLRATAQIKENLSHDMVAFRVTYRDFSLYYSSDILFINSGKYGTKPLDRWASARNIDQLNLSEDDWNVFIFESFM